MIKLKQLFGSCIVFLVAFAAAAVQAEPDLSTFPEPFADSEGNVLVVIGSDALDSDVLGGMGIASAVKFRSRQKSFSGPAENAGSPSSGGGGPASGTGRIYLDNEVAWPPEKPMILIGNACRNTIVRKLLDDAEPCQLPLQDTGIIKIFEHNNQPILLIYGNTAEDGRTAARALSSFKELQDKGVLNGTAVLVSGNKQKYEVTQLTDPEQYAKLAENAEAPELQEAPPAVKNEAVVQEDSVDVEPPPGREQAAVHDSSAEEPEGAELAESKNGNAEVADADKNKSAEAEGFDVTAPELQLPPENSGKAAPADNKEAQKEQKAGEGSFIKKIFKRLFKW